MKLNQQAERTRHVLAEVAKTFNLAPGELAGVFLTLAHDVYVAELKDEAAMAHWLWLAKVVYEKHTTPPPLLASAFKDNLKQEGQ